MILSQCNLFSELFEHIDPKTAVRTFFNATALFEYTQNHPESYDEFEMLLEKEWVEHIVEYRGVEERQIMSMSVERRDSPILAVHQPDDITLTIDGHHRTVRRWLDGFNWVLTRRVKPGFWEWCVVTDAEAAFGPTTLRVYKEGKNG